MRGTHYIKSWASTQKNITLSSGEAELVAMVNGSSEAIGLCQLAKDWGAQITAQVWVDPSAAIGVARRKGAGKLRHVEVGMLWIQELEEDGVLGFVKVPGKQNPADLMTKNVGAAVITMHLEKMGIDRRPGRAQASLNI